jgi:hypothetical protein
MTRNHLVAAVPNKKIVVAVADDTVGPVDRTDAVILCCLDRLKG